MIYWNYGIKHCVPIIPELGLDEVNRGNLWYAQLKR